MKVLITIRAKQFDHCLDCKERSPTKKDPMNGRVTSFCGYNERFIATSSYRFHEYNPEDETPDFENNDFAFFGQAKKEVKKQLRHNPIPDWCQLPDIVVVKGGV